MHPFTGKTNDQVHTILLESQWAPPENKINGPFRGPKNVLRMDDLILEHRNNMDYTVYTLRKWDNHTKMGGMPRTFWSLLQCYLEADDPTEYIFANRYFYSTDHFDRFMKKDWFKEYITTVCRPELERKHHAEVLVALRKDARNGNASSAKYLLELLEKGPEKSRGRPKKEVVVDETKLLLEESLMEQDLKRLKDGVITAVDGGPENGGDGSSVVHSAGSSSQTSGKYPRGALSMVDEDEEEESSAGTSS